ncbi:DUF7511 domain-containing protein [Halorarius litoreus]|uniref:DUF7511 domain-containing protein n=1 Tax=Halorarius litoreus TaxID=2962676 RepID=UPI0020CBDE95|nr:hypothetical protein [Halorarius litoreus]
MEGSHPSTAPEGLTATLVRYTDGPDQLTIHPSEADDVTLMGSWVTADADDFVELDSVR